VSEWTRVDGRELQWTGLLRQANEATFWPLGMALAVDVETGEITLRRIDPWEVIEPGDLNHERLQSAIALEAFMRSRIT
jgi:hypothetical protein